MKVKAQVKEPDKEKIIRETQGMTTLQMVAYLKPYTKKELVLLSSSLGLHASNKLPRTYALAEVVTFLRGVKDSNSPYFLASFHGVELGEYQ